MHYQTAWIFDQSHVNRLLLVTVMRFCVPIMLIDLAARNATQKGKTTKLSACSCVNQVKTSDSESHRTHSQRRQLTRSLLQQQK
jgi:hypothetical protein